MLAIYIYTHNRNAADTMIPRQWSMRGNEHEEHPNTQTTSFKGLRCAPDSHSAAPRREQVVERRDLNRAGVDTRPTMPTETA